MKRFTKKLDDRGAIILVFILILPILIMIAINYMQLSLTSFQVSRFDQLHTEAQLAADAGADYAVEQLAQNTSWSGTGGQTTLHTDSSIKTTYEASVTSTSSSKTISVIGRTFRPANSSTANRSVKIFVDLRPVTSGTFSVVSGEGGLFMSNSSKVVGGDVFVNGEINLSNTAQIGLSTNPLNVSVANQRCPNPPDATYPRVCGSGENGQPINLSNQAHIYGTVKATGQTNTNGMSSPGLVAGSPAPKTLPTYDRAAQKAAVATTTTGAAASCTNNGTKVWAANTKIVGNVSISNKCQVTVQGDVWITGTLSMSNSSQMIVADSMGSTRPNVMVDGQAGASFANSSSLTPNASGTGFEIYTFYSTDTCSPDCSSVTGTKLASSRSITTITLNNSGNDTNSIFYAYWSQVSVSNSGQIGALIGQTISLSNSGTITFGSSAGAADTTWVVKGYRRQY